MSRRHRHKPHNLHAAGRRTFACAATNTGHATFLTRREKTGPNGYLILPGAALGTNAPLHLAHTVGARAEEAQMPDDRGDTPAIGKLNYKVSK